MKFVINHGDESLTSHSGLALVGVLLNKTRLAKRLADILIEKKSRPEIFHEQIVKSMIGLLCLGKPDFGAIEPFREDEFFRRSLGLDQVPSEATLRQRLNAVEGQFDTILKEESAAMIKRHAPRLTPCYRNYVPLDIDVSPFDNSGTKKEGISFTYKKVVGYAPIFAYLGVEGYLINAELREGKQHCQNGTPAFLRETIELAKKVTKNPILIRLDSGNDSIENIAEFIKGKVHWLVKRNLRKESVDDWLYIAQRTGKVEIPRRGKKVYYGDLEVSKEGFEDRLFRQVFKVTVRETDREGQALLIPDVEVETYDTSLKASPETIIELYHAHGTSEQFHSEIKTDMDLERLPSGKFSTNALIILLGLVAYNCLRLIGQETLREEGVPAEELAPIRKEVSRRRLRSVIQDLIYMASRLTWHARRWGLLFGRQNPWFPTWKRIYERFTATSCMAISPCHK
jgi:hypothetical protein